MIPDRDPDSRRPTAPVRPCLLCGKPVPCGTMTDHLADDCPETKAGA